jgi:hypothetical protein
VLLPAEAEAWPNERRRLVLLHELAHVARRDSLSRSAASLACALYWFHPGAWFAARRMSMEQEHAADDLVLNSGGSARAYARSLLHLAAPADSRLRPAHAASMAGMYELERRLVSIIHPARRDRPTPAFLASSALLASLATLVVAAGVPVSASLPSPLSAEPAGIAPAPAAPGPPPDRAVESGGLPAGTGNPREAEPGSPAEEAGRGSARARSFADAKAWTGRERGGKPALHGDPAVSGGSSSRGPGIPMTVLRRETFTLSSSAPAQAVRLGSLSSLHPASNEPPGLPAARLKGPRSFKAPEPARERRAPSLRRPRLVLAVGDLPLIL